MKPIYSSYAPSFVYVDGYRFPEQWAFQEEKVPYSLLRYIEQGRAVFSINHQQYEVQKGDVFYIPQGCHLFCQAKEELAFISIRFVGTSQLPGEDMLDLLWHIPPCTRFGEEEEMASWFRQVYHAAVSKKTYKRLVERGYLNLICAALAERAGGNEESGEPLVDQATSALDELNQMKDTDFLRRRMGEMPKNTDPRVQALVDYIKLHPGSNFSREEMCKIVGISESTLRRIFKAQTGKTVYEFIKETKMSYAVHLLLTTVEPISRIAYQLGYESPSYFTEVFHANYGVSPMEYRRHAKLS